MNTGNVLQKIWALPLVMLLAAFMSVGSASAQNTYYVDVVTGNDTNNGSQMAVGLFPAGPFKTINQAMTTAVNGDTIVILAGDYTAEGVLTNTEDLTLAVRTSGGNVNVVFDGFTMATATRTLTLADEAGGGAGVFLSNADGDELTLTSGTVNVTGALTFAGGATVTRTAGVLSGVAPTVTNLNVTYTGALTANQSTGNELPASIGTGTLTINHTGALITASANTSVGALNYNNTGSFTFSGSLTSAGAVAFNAGATTGTATFGALTANGGLSSNAAADLTITVNGAVSVDGGNAVLAGDGPITASSFDINDNLLDNDGAVLNISGALTIGDAGAGTRIDNEATITAGSITVEPMPDTAGNEADKLHTIDNGAGTLTVSGAINEGVTVATNGEGAASETEYNAIALVNAANGKLSIGANSTIRGNINNAEATGNGAATNDGIILNNNASLTVSLDQAGINANVTQFGDFVGGTLVVNYSNGGTDGASGGTIITQANNVTFTSEVDVNPAAAGTLGAVAATTYSIAGDVRLQDAGRDWQTTFIIGGTLFIEAQVDILAAAPGAHSVNGLNISAAGVTFAADAMTVRGTVAALNNATFAAAFTATSADVTATSGAGTSFTSFAGKSLTITHAAGQSTEVAGTFDVGGDVNVPNGATLALSALGGTSDIDGTFNIDGTVTVAGVGQTLTIKTLDIDASTGTFTDNGAGANTYVLEGNWTGGTFTAADDNVTLNVPSGGATISVKPGTAINLLTINGSGRTATFTESITMAGGATLGNDVTVALGANSFVLSGGDLTLTDEAVITNSGSDGSVQFTGTAAQNINVTGTPTTTPSLQNVFVNNSAGAPAVDINQNINIAGTLTVLNGVVRADNATVTFTGSSAKIAYKADTGDQIATNGTGSFAGTRDLEYIGNAGNAGAEYTATLSRNVTVSTTGAVTFPATNATFSGNLQVNTNASVTTQATVTVNGNATLNGNVTTGAGNTFSVGGALSIADGFSLNGAGAVNVVLTGDGQTHTLRGILGNNTTLKVSASNAIMNGAVAAAPGSDADGDSELQNILVDASKSITFNTIQDVNGTVTVNGTATLNLATDGANVNDTDGQIAGAVTVNNGGALTVATTATVGGTTNDAFSGTVTVNDGGTLTAGSSLIANGGAVTVGNNSQAAAATLDLNGNTLTLDNIAGALNVTSSTGNVAPSFGTSGTVVLPSGATYTGTTNPTFPNFTVQGANAATPEIDNDMTVTGTFTVAGAAEMGNGDNVTLSGANAVGQINANLTATIGTTGGTLITTGTAIRSTAAAVTITNLNVNSTSSTTLENNDPAAGQQTTTFTVAFLNHDAGVLDFNNNNLTIVGDNNAATTDWDYDGGSYSNASGNLIIDDAGDNEEIDLDTNNQTISIANLQVNDDAAAAGLKIGASDGVTVTGTLVLGTNSAAAAANIDTENGATDGTFSVANGATINRRTDGAGDHFANAPTLGTGITVRYTSSTAGDQVTTGNELPTSLARLEWENTGAASDLFLEDGVALTLDQLELGGNLSIDEDDDGNNSITINTGGRIEYDGALASFTDQGAAANPDEVPSFAGTSELQFNAGFGATATTDLTWPDALVPTVSVGSSGANVNVTMHESRTAAAVTVGDGNTTNTSTVTIGGALTLTVSGAATINSDGTVTGGTLDANGALSNTGALTSAVRASQSITLTGNLANLTLDGTTAQTLTVPNAGANLTTFVVNNTAGVTVSGGNIAVGTQTVAAGVANAITGGLTLTNGVLNLGSNTMLLSHAGSGIQGYTRTNGCVYGNVRKQLSNTTNTAPADRLEFPLCSMGGVYRPYAITFNNPNTIGGTAPTAGAPTTSAAPAITVKHDVSGENSVAEITGTNGLPQMTNGVNIARYPLGPSFFWTVSPSFTMSPSLSYDVDMRANDYSNFSSSCGTAACDINEIYPIRRHVGSNSNLWSVATSTIDNFLAGSDDPVVVGRAATGALQTSGTIFTYGLKSIFAASGTAPAVTITTGNTHVVDLSTLFTGYTGSLTYTAVSSDDTDVTAPGTGNVAGNNLTLTGGAKAGSATVTVNATNSFGSTASATFTVTNGAALTASADDLSRTLNVGDTSTVTFASAFSGGAGAVTYTAASSDASVTVASDGTTVTMTAASNGSATITLTGVDASTTAVTVTKTFTVTVNNAVSVAGAIADQTVTQGATATIDVSGVFANGTGAITVAVSGGNTTASATISGTTVTITGLAAYAGSPLADTPAVTITLTGTDTIGGTATDAFDVTVNPVAGAVSGGGAVSAFDASLILNEFLGKSNPALTAKQLVAADFDGDNDIDPFDAYQVYVAAGGTPKAEIRNAFASADVAFGEMTQNGTVISLPIVITGDVAEAAAISFQTMIDPAIATVAEVVNNSDWLMVSDVAEDGTVRFAAIGGESLPADGVVATININVPETFAAFTLNGQGAVNNNTISDIDAVEVIEIPGTFALDGNYPNPFNPTTTIQFDLPESADVEVQVFDMIGRQVMSIPSHTIAAGAKRSIQLNASQLASGSYFYRVVAKMKDSVAIDTGRMTLVK